MLYSALPSPKGLVIILVVLSVASEPVGVTLSEHSILLLLLELLVPLVLPLVLQVLVVHVRVVFGEVSDAWEAWDLGAGVAGVVGQVVGVLVGLATLEGISVVGGFLRHFVVVLLLG